MPRFDGIAFDKDGTLFDFNATWGRWAKGFLLAECGGDADLFRRASDRLSYDPETERFQPESLVIASTAGDVVLALAEVLDPADPAGLEARLLETTTAAPQVEVTPLAPFARGLRGMGAKLAVITNDAEAPARGNLASVDAEGCFDFIAGYDSGYGAKPDPGPLLAFSDRFGLEPARCVMVGDSLHDLHAAAAAGFVPVAVLTGVADATELGPAAEVVLPSIADLPAWLGG